MTLLKPKGKLVGRLTELQLQREAEAEAESLPRSGVHACSVSSSHPHRITKGKEHRPLRSAACFILSLYSKFKFHWGKNSHSSAESRQYSK